MPGVSAAEKVNGKNDTRMEQNTESEVVEEETKKKKHRKEKIGFRDRKVILC